jgi:hypothetical protein
MAPGCKERLDLGPAGTQGCSVGGNGSIMKIPA